MSEKYIHFKPTLLNNLWIAKYNILSCVLFFFTFFFIEKVDSGRVLVGLVFYIIFIGIPLFGFLAIAAHAKYYFGIEKGREIILTTDKIKIKVDIRLTKEIDKKRYQKLSYMTNLSPMDITSFRRCLIAITT